MKRSYASLFLSLITSQGYCCPYAFFRFKRKHSQTAIADYLGVSNGTVSYWKRQVKAGECYCARARACQLDEADEPHATLRERPFSVVNPRR